MHNFIIGCLSRGVIEHVACGHDGARNIWSMGVSFRTQMEVDPCDSVALYFIVSFVECAMLFDNEWRQAIVEH